MVSYLTGRSKPFRLQFSVNGRRTARYFATEREALAARTAHRAIQATIARTKREALAEKRAKDVAVRGGNSALERDFAVALVAEWRRKGPS